MKISKESLSVEQRDGFVTSLFIWRDAEISPKAVVHIFHGMAEHAERYEHFAHFLCKHHYIVYAHNHRGHGQSMPKDDLGFFATKNGWNCVVEDAITVFEHSRTLHSDIPYFIFGHSMGSLIARNFAMLKGNEINGLIVCGTAPHPGLKGKIGLYVTEMLRIIFGAKAKSTMMNKLTFGDANKKFEPRYTDFDFLSRDRKEVNKYISDPLCGFICSNTFYHDLINGAMLVNTPNNCEKIPSDLPILLISGESDPVGEYGKGVEKVYAMLKESHHTNVSLKLYENARHELLNELNKLDVYSDITKFLNSLAK